MLLPIIHRHAPGRLAAIERVQQDPSWIGPEGTEGVNQVTCVVGATDWAQAQSLKIKMSAAANAWREVFMAEA